MQQCMEKEQTGVSDESEVIRPLDKKTIEGCRHKAEKRWYRRLIVLNILIIIGVTAAFIKNSHKNKEYIKECTAMIADSVNSEEGQDSQPGSKAEEKKAEKTKKTKDDSKDKSKKSEINKMEDIQDKLPDNMYLFGMMIFLILAMPLVVHYAYAHYRSMSVRITRKTYPEIYEIVEEYATKLQMKKVPEIYIIQGNGILNAFSSFIPGKQYIELYADLVEVAYREHHDMGTLRFIIAHEISHIYFKHATMRYYYSILIADKIPIFSQAASRAREYTCDRLAQLLSGNDGIDAMMALTTGIHLYKQVDKEEYIQQAETIKGFFVFLFNLFADHPVTCKRVAALNKKEESGRLY